MKRILLVAVAVIVGVPLLMTAWFCIGGIETGDTSSPDDADLLWTPPEVADEDNAFVAILATTNLVNCSALGTNSWDKADSETPCRRFQRKFGFQCCRST